MEAGDVAEWLLHAESDLTYAKLGQVDRRFCEIRLLFMRNKPLKRPLKPFLFTLRLMTNFFSGESAFGIPQTDRRTFRVSSRSRPVRFPPRRRAQLAPRLLGEIGDDRYALKGSAQNVQCLAGTAPVTKRQENIARAI